VTVVSDEIHQDFVFKGKHQVFAGLKKGVSGYFYYLHFPK